MQMQFFSYVTTLINCPYKCSLLKRQKVRTLSHSGECATHFVNFQLQNIELQHFYVRAALVGDLRMKKSLIALAALSAFATAAQAQSSVTVYGGVGGSVNSTEYGNVKSPSQFQNAGQDFFKTTALGFRGTEDLGGGNTAFFQLEGDLSMSGQLGSQAVGDTDSADNVAASTSNVSNNIFNRHAHVGLTSKQFGTLSLGRQNDSVKDLEGLGQVSNLSDNLHLFTLVGDRYAGIVKYATPTINGFKATYSYTNNAANTGGATDTAVNTTADGARTLNSYAISYATGNYSFGAGQGTITEVGSADKETTYLGARGVFGNVTVGAHYTMNKDGANELDQTLVSVNYTMGKIDLKAHYVNNDATGARISSSGNATNNSSGAEGGNGYGLMAVYNLSKRTAAYAAIADFSADDATKDSKVTTIGVHHAF
jgi:predicted porin